MLQATGLEIEAVPFDAAMSHPRFRSIERGSFFQPSQFHFEPANLFVQFCFSILLFPLLPVVGSGEYDAALL